MGRHYTWMTVPELIAEIRRRGCSQLSLSALRALKKHELMKILETDED